MASYHHGDLPAALRAATAELVAQKGPSGFSLREVARRAGVSHAAPAHHFGDSEGLLTSVAAEGFRHLADRLESAGEGVDDAFERIRRAGHAYVDVATDHPGHFAVMLQADLVCSTDADLLHESLRAYSALQRVITMIRDQHNPDLDVDAASIFCWSAIQGLVVLSPNLQQVAADTGTSASSLDELVEQFATFMLDGFAAR